MDGVSNIFANHALIAVLPSAALGAIGIALLWTTRHRRRGTTLVAPAGWAGFSLLLIVAGDLALAVIESAWLAEPIRFAAATTSVCPAIALLGAKRPQNQAWQFIVGSLWGIFLLTSLQSAVFYRGESMVIFAAWKYLLWILIAVGATNYLGTRFWLAAMLMAAGQIALLSPFLVEAMQVEWWGGAALGMSLFCLAIGISALGIPRRVAASSSLDRVWLDFRDAFGVVWALRIAQRVRGECRLESAQVHDAWQGIARLADKSAEHDLQLEEIERTLESLLKRFVSADWLPSK